jgi:WD40 repeat protein
MGEFSPVRIFISYARSDGRAFAEKLERRLQKEAGIRSWRDLKDVISDDIRAQALRAIEAAEHSVLIVTRSAIVSDWVKREWSHARMCGRMVSPVLADPTLRRADLPAWLRRAEVYDIAEPERWRKLVQVLTGPGQVRRVHYDTGNLPDDFVPRPEEYARLREAVLSERTDKTVALTTALSGAGGYGKTTLANYLCLDRDVRDEFTDGILRVDIGKERNDVIGLVLDLIEKLDPEGKRPGFQDVQVAAGRLAEQIGEARLLLVIDDVWREAQLQPFLRPGPNCVQLVTTRLPHVLPALHIPIKIDAMRAAEGLELISAGLSNADAPNVESQLAALVERLGGWAQMLGIANGWMRDRVSHGEPLPDTTARFQRRLLARGLTGFDPQDETQRNRAIRICVEASIEDLRKNQLDRFGELAVLPEDESIPLGIIEALWHETGGLDTDETEDLIQQLNRLSLLQELNLGTRTLRLHDNTMWYLRDRIGAEGCRAAHAAMVGALKMRCGGNWETLPPDDIYGWRFLIRHLREAGEDKEADRLLTDYGWIKAKLRISGARGLFDSYLPERQDEGAQLVGRAVALSLPALAADPRGLPRQLYGRLGSLTHQAIAASVAAAKQDPDFRPAPRWPGLTPPGAERLRLVGHDGEVTSASFSADGGRVVTASLDSTARVWDARTGQEIAALRGHEGFVRSASFSADGGRVVTVSRDRTARVWDARTGAEIVVWRGEVNSAAFSSDGESVVTASNDRTARVWDARTGAEIVALRGHEREVNSAAFSSDGRSVVTASNDRTARVWDVRTGAEIATLRGHELWVDSASFSADGGRVVTASQDRTARAWDARTGQEIAALRGHEASVRSASFSADGGRVVTACKDRTARAWDARTGAEIVVLRGHEREVNSASFSSDGGSVVTASNDRTARVWDARTGAEIAALQGHDGAVNSASFSADGGRVVTASDDRTARVWDARPGQGTAELHDDWVEVNSASLSADSTHVLAISYDGTPRIWDARSGAEIAALWDNGGDVLRTSIPANGRLIVTALADFSARVWDRRTGEKIATLRGHASFVSGTYDRRRAEIDALMPASLVRRAYDPTPRIPRMGAQIAALRGREGNALSGSFSVDGGRVLTVSCWDGKADWWPDGTARIWDACTGEEIAVLRVDEEVESASFSADGGRVVTVSSGDTARVWDAHTGQEIAALRGHKGHVNSVSFSADGGRVVTASHDRTACVWDARTGQEIATLRGHEGDVNSASFSADGGRVVTASDDRTACVWDARTGQEIATLRGHEGDVNGASFSADGGFVVTASHDRTARLWDARTGEELVRIALDAAVTILDVSSSAIALSDALGRTQVFDAEEFLIAKGSAGG